jgi:succinate-semialdehyde dehydrogenase/glutarate-semialdehyde dehydrogenase
VFSVVTGDAADAPIIGGELTSNPIVRKVGFTGSTEVGKLLMAQCSKQLRKISLELGGNAPFIIFDDARVDDAVAGTLVCKYRNSGQTCISANRILVQDRVYDEYLEKLVAAVTKLKVGVGTDPGVNVGPLIDDAGFEKVQRHVDEALGSGAKLVTGGRPHELGRTFFEPTVLVDVEREMLMSSEETFGPVAGIARFSSEEDAVRAANDTPYGLAAYFYSRDVGRVWRVSEALDYGIVGINTGFISTEVAPFGGMKESGIGREGSRYGIDDWVELKYLAAAGLDS